MKIFKAKQRGLLIVCCMIFITAIASFVFAKPSFEVAPQSEPTVSAVSVAPATQDRGSGVVISANVVDVSGVSYAKAEIKNAANTVVATVNLYDDGAHSDGVAGDNVYGNSWTIPASFAAGNYGVFIVASDTLGYIYTSAVANANLTVTIPSCTPSKTCADYPGQCGTTLFNGCANVLNCSGSCTAPKICCSGTCQNPVCSNNGSCNDGNNCTTDLCNNPNTCLASCSNNPIAACINGDGCCPAGCNSGNDSDCAACVPTCATGPACHTIPLANASVTVAVCCGAGESCYQCDAGYTWDGSTCVAVCTDTCFSLSYECGTHTICGVATDCGSCTAPKTCDMFGKCVTVSTLSATIIAPEDGTEFTQGEVINFEGFALGGTPGYTYKWLSDGAAFDSGAWDGAGAIWGNTNALPAGAHTITLAVIDSGGTTASDSISITIHPAGTLTAQIQMWRTEFANGEWLLMGANVSGGTAPYTFVWNSDKKEGDFSTSQWPSVDLSATPWTIGNHTITLTVTDSAANTATDVRIITIVNMTADIQPTDGEHFIYGEIVFFNAMVIGGTVPYTFSWVSDLEGAEIGNTDWFSRDNLQQGVHIITVTIKDSGGITIVKTFRIQIDLPPLLIIAIDNPADGSTFNQGDIISFEGSYTGGMGPYAISWKSDLDLEIYTHTSSPDFTKNNLTVGTHTITLTVKDNSGQIATASITVIINPSGPLVAAINSPNNGDTFFRIDDFVEFDGSATGGVSPFTYKWESDQIDGDITPTSGPTNKFFKNDLSANFHIITLTITDNVGATATDNVNITINANCADNNIKDGTKYSVKETFLIADTNWQNVLSLVPLAIWNDGGTIKKYPALIYYHEAATHFDADSTIHFMQMYEPSHLTTIGSIPANLNNLFIAAEPIGAGINAGNISNINPSDYFSYWSSYGSLVVVDYDNYKAGLMASVFASHRNSPIIFVNSANLAAYQAMINGNKIYTVGSLDAATQTYIDGNASCQVKYTLEELQKWYATETNSDKLILVNPNDLNIKLNDTFFPEKSGWIDNKFNKMSLAAPFLAAVKQEVIAYTELPDSGINNTCAASAIITSNIATADADTANAITNLFPAHPSYLTIIASPKAIPDSEYASCHTLQLRNPKDWRYGSLDNSYDLGTGRIYGITVADASSYVFKSVFFDQLVNKIYGTNYTGISIGHSFADDENDTSLIQNRTFSSGYNSVCFVWSAGYANCTTGNVSPPVSTYQGKRFITFADHGSTSGWSATLSSDEIPWLDLPYVNAMACSTGNYWQADLRGAFSVNAIRRGAIGYWGAVGLAYAGVGYPSKSLKKLTGADHDAATLGETFLYVWPFQLLGDPTLQLKLKQVSW